MKTAVIIGAGPAGLTAAYELRQKSKDWEIIVVEATDVIGGISAEMLKNRKFVGKPGSVERGCAAGCCDRLGLGATTPALAAWKALAPADLGGW